MPDQPSQHNNSGCLTACLVGGFYGVGYSVEIFLHREIGERRLRDMGVPLFVALTVLLAVTMLANQTPRPQYAGASPYPAFRSSYRYPAFARGYRSVRPNPESDIDPPTRAQVRFWLPFVFCGYALLAQACHRVRGLWRRRRGPRVHSYYSGHPFMLWPSGKLFYRNLTELACKQYLEPLVTVAAGIALAAAVSPELGYYLVLGGVVMGVTVSARAHHEREMTLDAGDGMIDMMTHQEGVAAEQDSATQPASAAQVVMAKAPEAPRRANPAAPAASWGPAKQPTQAKLSVPAALCEGLNENLLQLLREQPQED